MRYVRESFLQLRRVPFRNLYPSPFHRNVAILVGYFADIGDRIVSWGLKIGV